MSDSEVQDKLKSYFPDGKDQRQRPQVKAATSKSTRARI